ncbi:hypothetical protein N7507_003483 [Penicillium longicatenatum]|nr:hypothetical protein N7507_003483 [Penicillium longicatenatum]
MNLARFLTGSLSVLFFNLAQIQACPPPEQYMPPLRLAGSPEAELWSRYSRGYIENNNTHTDLEPRWARVPESSSQWWPSASIIYCYADGAEETLDNDLRSAWDIWIQAGVPSRFVFKQGTDADCAASNVENVLTVSLDSEAKLKTSLGKVSGGSKMILNPSTAIGMENPIWNYAHEIGHAWGLMHEHQRPDQWDSNHGGSANDNKFIWNCENLDDYDTKVASLGEFSINQVCTKRGSAEMLNFSALDYLPTTDRQMENSGTVDYDSIMMYPSVAGGIRTSSGRKTVYTLADGTAIGYNNVPTVNDVDNLIAMYPASSSSSTTCFLYQKCSQYLTSFKSTVGCMVADDDD